MKRLFLFVIFLFSLTLIQAQFKFSGELSRDYIGAKAYNQFNTFLLDQVVQEVGVDSLGLFSFSGDFLSEEKSFYKIYIGACENEVTDAKHLLNHCDRILETTFIANNSDQIHFPINDLRQEFCEIDSDKKISSAILQLDLLQEGLLGSLSGTKSDAQRKSVYKTYFKELQSFAKTYQDPLVELYAYSLYVKRGFPSRVFYLNDLKESTYYKELLDELKERYAGSSYTMTLENELKSDNYFALKEPKSSAVWMKALFWLLLVLSMLLNAWFYFKQKKLKVVKEEQVDYKKVLTGQEQKVFELMY